MGDTERERALRKRADVLAAALVVLGCTPERAEDATVDLAVQHATLLAAALAPYGEDAPDPDTVYGGPAVFALAAQNVHGRPVHRHMPVHDHLISLLAVAADHVRALFGADGDGHPQPRLLLATRGFLHALIGTAGRTAQHLRSAYMGPTGRQAPSGAETISYAVDGDVLARAAADAAHAAERLRTELDRLT
ncbi:MULTISPECIES: hypothetical protein [Streptomycetaceae]|uniref:Uncharacterized protein n=1 Tax=Streptantibioticus cattleyicolor (strain ATCC 35852 / DSM 46488 / JCM 4925 / NBRC 14057 / NRRL 8057) TaxID=1003195 RepID=F8JZC7_STREN|nr:MULTISPECIES: hypothetical protein [Streptomycetaceae]AEW96007.1 hypothetical protein SCATT_36360 [Streptantibioticus cattleyicolor NRRL 8057 = DSM 46488]MYS60539.1 hypothetical protein [Streptomyces sp. SID5468]CCB76340.1 protein of unknown function [Streptantibioticus cattleyicolor NRRL 8057 = DSM 46488]